MNGQNVHFSPQKASQTGSTCTAVGAQAAAGQESDRINKVGYKTSCGRERSRKPELKSMLASFFKGEEEGYMWDFDLLMI